MATKRGSEIQVGDVVVFMGTPHRVARIDPPTPETLGIMPGCIGFDADSATRMEVA